MKLVCAECRSKGYSYDVFVRCKDKWLAVDITKGFHAPVRHGKTYGEAKARLMKWFEFAKDFGTGRFCKDPDEFRLSYSGLCRRLDYDKDEVD